ncbi:hypothetical protein HPULCUR_008841 [Helicostylum pulchrum]|uniref:Nuclear pore protein n=1 Tax=Helicostylum pulchrum TaxID=562976 RepID=A0ABP9YAN0_9FUNG
MSLEILKQLRQKSELILSDNDRGNFPMIQKSLDQMEREMNAMNERIKPTPELHAKAHYFLASSGIDTDYVSNAVDTSHTFESIQMEDHTDIKKFLNEEHERILIDIIEEQRNINNEQFDDFYKYQFEEFIEENDRERMEEDENTNDLKEFEKDNVNTGINRINDYAKIITMLNQDRLMKKDCDVLKQLSSIRNLSDLKRSQDGAEESWSILNHIINKSGINGRLEGRFLKDYITQPYHSVTATQTRRQLIGASKSWLEQQSSQFINDVLNKNASKTQVGGIPSFTHRLRAYIDLTYKTTSGWTDGRIEVVNEVPIWVFMYLLIRSGHMDLAIKFVDSNGEMFASERKFVSYFKEYNSAKDHCVSRSSQEAILADYYRFGYGDENADPFKVVIYKILGRCELHNKNSPDVIKTTEDYIWLQLMLIREVTDTERYSFERYRLEDFQKEITALGSKYFDRDETNPYTFFRILLLTLQFEEAIEHFCKQKKLRLETVHFALALVYCGLLNVTSPEKVNIPKILIINEENRATLNFPRLVDQYVKVYLADKPNEALQYVCLSSLYSVKQGYPNDAMVQIAKNYICKFTLNSKDFKTILGTDGQERSPGLIDNQRGLLNINSENEFASEIIRPIAEKCVQTGRCIDAVYAYSLSGDYNQMADVLAKELSDALQQPQSFRATDPTLSQYSNTEIIQFALETIRHCENKQYISSSIDESKKVTIRILIQLLQFRVAYEQGQHETALQLMQQANVIPLQGNMEQIQLYVNQFGNLAETIKKNIPELLLNAMDSLYKLWSNNSGHASELENLERKSRTLLTFTGLINFAIPNDIIVRLNK